MKRDAARDPLDTTTEIETPEHVRFRYPVAGPARRALAYLFDLLVRGALAFAFVVVGILGGVTTSDSVGRASGGVVLVVIFLLDWAYFVFFETIWSGRTPGKRLLGLRVVTESGHPLRFADSLLRNLLRAADWLPPLGVLGSYGVGLAVMGRDPRFRRLGDLVAGTIVVVEDRRVVAGPLRLDPPPTLAELRGIPQRVPLSGDEVEAIELFLRRQGRLSPARENELAEMVAPVFAKRLGVRYKDATRFLGLLHHRAREQQGQRRIG